jgi:hypothetical protein
MKQMGKHAKALLFFVLGVVIASIAWLAVVWWLQFQMVTSILLTRETETLAGTKILRYLRYPTPEHQHGLAYMATNMLDSLTVTADMAAEEYPYLPINSLWANKLEYYSLSNIQERINEPPNNPSHHTTGSCAEAQPPAAGER